MEHWEQILIGVIIGTFLILLLFLILDRTVFQDWKKNGRNYDNVARSALLRWPIKYRNSLTRPRGYRKLSDNDDDDDDRGPNVGMDEKIANDLYDEYESFEHECLVFIGNKGDRICGICLYLLDRYVEYFCESFPESALNNLKNFEADQLAKVAAMSAIITWSKKWSQSKKVRILHGDINVIADLNDTESIISKKAREIAEDYNFRLLSDWTENYVCDVVANEELWEGVIICGNQLLSDPEAVPWEELGASENWQRKRIALKESDVEESIQLFSKTIKRHNMNLISL